MRRIAVNEVDELAPYTTAARKAPFQVYRADSERAGERIHRLFAFGISQVAPFIGQFEYKMTP